MTLSRRNALKVGLSAGALPLLVPSRLLAQEQGSSPEAREREAIRARPLPLHAVRLTGGPLKQAQVLDATYLLALEPDRMLAYYRERAGLPRKAQPYGGWDGGGRNLTGHVAGHYLSAISLMWAATGDQRFKTQVDYIVRELKEVQDKHGDGYLSALEGGRKAFGALARGEIRSAAFDLNGEWSPWYTLHKTFAGLRDAYRFAGNRTALEVEARFAGWAEGILSPLSEAQTQQMLNTEFGGMNEALLDLYHDTGDARWLALSRKFEHVAFIQPLERHQDDLGGTHANTQVPKMIGEADRFAYAGSPGGLLAAGFFFDQVVQHHSFATGGHGTDEYFGPPDQLSGRVDGRTCESCNVYNMLKLTRRLFSFRPDPYYADYQERALYNHALASIDPQDGRMCYMVPVGRGVQHEYQEMFEDFTCCMGTGMENHALHGDGIYYESGDRLWVTVYAPSTAEWAEAGVRLAMETDFPEGEAARLTMTLKSPKTFTLAMRRPWWAGQGFSLKVNGEAVTLPQETEPQEAGPRRSQYARGGGGSSFVEIARTWKSGDMVEVALPKSLRLEPLPDNARRAALMWGPLVLAGDLGPEAQRGPEGERRSAPPKVPVLVAAEQPVVAWLRPVSGTTGAFRTDGVGRDPDAQGQTHDLELMPFYRLHRRTYGTYWDLFTPAEWEAQKAAYIAEAERLRALEAATVAWLQPGETVFERPFNYQGGPDASPQRIQGRPGRRGDSWFSYDVPVEPAHPMTLVLTFFSGDRRAMPADFDVLVDGQVVASPQLRLTDPQRFFDVEQPIPPARVQGKTKVTVRFQAKDKSQIATVFGVRMIRGDAAR